MSASSTVGRTEFTFDGTNFESWRAWMIVYLASKGMLQCVQYDPDDLYDQYLLTADHSIDPELRQMLLVAFRLQDLKCAKVLLQNISGSYRKHFHYQHSASDIWSILKSKYGNAETI